MLSVMGMAVLLGRLSTVVAEAGGDIGALSPPIREQGERLRALREAHHMPHSMLGGNVGIDGDHVLTDHRT